MTIQQAVDTVVQKGVLETENGGWYLERDALRELTGIDLCDPRQREPFFEQLNQRPEVEDWFFNSDLSGMGVDFDPALCPNLTEPGMQM